MCFAVRQVMCWGYQRVAIASVPGRPVKTTDDLVLDCFVSKSMMGINNRKMLRPKGKGSESLYVD